MSTIKNNQSTVDISTQLNGDVRSVVDFCIKNNLNITEDININTTFVGVETIYKNEIVSEAFFKTDYELTTGEPKIKQAPAGIGTMTIGSSFKVI